MKLIRLFGIAILLMILPMCSWQKAIQEDMEDSMQDMQRDAHGDEHGESEGLHVHDDRLFGPGSAPHVMRDDPVWFDRASDIAKRPDDLPSKTSTKIVLTAKEVISSIAPDVEYAYWTFDETVPGPFLRVREGDTIELTLKNHPTSSHNHSIDLHAVTGPGGGATLTQVEQGKNKTIHFKALNPGLYVYHCATPNVPTHIANGMYGLILVEPKAGLPPVDREFYVMQGELYTEGGIGEHGHQWFSPKKMLEEEPEYVVFNGRIDGLVDYPARANVGEKVRFYVGNGGVAKVSSFHIIGEIFDTVYPEASSSRISNVQTTLVPVGGASIVELNLEVPGDYVLVDHALARIDRGAWGILRVEGKQDPSVYRQG